MFDKRMKTSRQPSSLFVFICSVFLLIFTSTCMGTGRSTKQEACPRVIGGSDAPKERFPYMCSIRKTDNLEHACGGTLIKRRWLITAAHCLDPNDSDSARMSPLIYCNIHEKDENDISKTYSAKAVYIHGKWESDVETGFDIALIKLDRAASLSVPKLATATTSYPRGDGFSVLGWGFTENNKCTDKLQIGLNLDIVRRYTCSREGMWGQLITDSMICAGTGSVDAARGDSGGPFLQLDDPLGHYENGDPSLDLVVGITSFGIAETERGRVERPGVYTSIGFFREWIDCIIEGRISKEDCPTENDTASSSADPTAISSDPPADPPNIEESAPSPEDEDCIDFEPFGDDFEDEDALERMMQAIEIDDSFTVGCILETGLDANTRHTVIEIFLPVNTSLLHHATLHNAVKSTKVLVDRGANVDIRDGREQTPLHVAAEYGSLGVAKVLVHEGAKLNVKSKRGDSPLHYAIFYKHKSIVKFLIIEGADVNSKNVNEETPLHLAAAKGFVSIVELLLANKASKVETTYSGKTPFEVICEETNQNEDCDDKTISKLEDLLRID